MSSAAILTGCWKKLTARGNAETERRQTAVVKSGRAAPQPFPFSSARPGSRMRVSGEEAGADSVSHAEIPRGVQTADVKETGAGALQTGAGPGHQ